MSNRKTFQLVAISNFLKGNEFMLDMCLPVLRDEQENFFFVKRPVWKWPAASDKNKDTGLIRINPLEVKEVGSQINPNQIILEHQIVAQAGSGFIELVQTLNGHASEQELSVGKKEIFDGFVDLQDGFKIKALYLSELEQMERDIVDIALEVFDRELGLGQNQELTPMARKALRLFRHISTEDKFRLRKMATCLGYSAKIEPTLQRYRYLAEYYAGRSDKSELSDTQLDRWIERYSKNEFSKPVSEVSSVDLDENIAAIKTTAVG